MSYCVNAKNSIYMIIKPALFSTTPIWKLLPVVTLLISPYVLNLTLAQQKHALIVSVPPMVHIQFAIILVLSLMPVLEDNCPFITETHHYEKEGMRKKVLNKNKTKHAYWQKP